MGIGRVITVLFLGAKAWACDPSCTIHSALLQQFDLLQKISMVGSENRETYTAYAKKRNLSDEQMLTLVSGTGLIRCYDGEDYSKSDYDDSGANLVSQSGCLALDSHVFMAKDKKGNCRFKNPRELKSCFFGALDAKGRPVGKPLEIDPTSLKLPKGATSCSDPKVIGLDWAVIKLKEPVPENIAKAYEIFDMTQLGTVETKYPKVDKEHQLQVSVVAMPADNFSDPNAATICDGTVATIGTQKDSNGNLQFAHTNSCSSGKGSSGGSVTVRRGNDKAPELFGVISRTKSSKHDREPYGVTNFTPGTIIQGEFLQAINECKKAR
jgi:hypothetical protein